MEGGEIGGHHKWRIIVLLKCEVDRWDGQQVVGVNRGSTKDKKKDSSSNAAGHFWGWGLRLRAFAGCPYGAVSPRSITNPWGT